MTSPVAHLPPTNENDALTILQHADSGADEKTTAALALHREWNDDGRHEKLILEQLEPLVESEQRFQGGRPAFLEAVKLVAELACRRQRWTLANNALLLVNAYTEDSPAWVRNYRAKVFFRINPVSALKYPDVTLKLLGPLNTLDAQGTAVVREFLTLARDTFAGLDTGESQFENFSALVRPLLEGVPGIDPEVDAPVPDDLSSDSAAEIVNRPGAPVETVDHDAFNIDALASEPSLGASNAGALGISPDAVRLVRELEELKAANELLRQTNTELIEELEGIREERSASSHLPATDSVVQDSSHAEVPEQPLDIGQILGRRHILLLGDIQVKDQHIYGIAKSQGLERDHLVLVTDYSKLTGFDALNLQYSMNCAGIIVGPVPHKMKGIGSESSPLQLFSTGEGFPPTVAMRDKSGELKGSKTAFKQALIDLITQLKASTPAS